MCSDIPHGHICTEVLLKASLVMIKKSTCPGSSINSRPSTAQNADKAPWLSTCICTHTEARVPRAAKGTAGSGQRHLRALGTSVSFVRDANGTVALTFHNPLSVKQTLEHFNLKPDDAWDVFFTTRKGRSRDTSHPLAAADLGAGCINAPLQGVSQNVPP